MNKDNCNKFFESENSDDLAMPLKPIRTGINTKDTIKFTTTPTAIIFPKSITGKYCLVKVIRNRPLSLRHHCIRQLRIKIFARDSSSARLLALPSLSLTIICTETATDEINSKAKKLDETILIGQSK